MASATPTGLDENPAPARTDPARKTGGTRFGPCSFFASGDFGPDEKPMSLPNFRAGTASAPVDGEKANEGPGAIDGAGRATNSLLLFSSNFLAMDDESLAASIWATTSVRGDIITLACR